MSPPTNALVYEAELASFWFSDKILYARSKPAERTLEAQKRTYAFIRKISGGKKVCMLGDATHSAPQDKETREYIAKEMPNLFKAMAVISGSATGQAITKVFQMLKEDPIPIALFSDEEEAKKWLIKYL